MHSYYHSRNEDFNSVNDIVYYYAQEFSKAPRNQDGKEILNPLISLKYPRNRNLFLRGKENNPFAAWAELLWMLGGDEYLNPVMTAFIPQCTEFSDDGKTWHDAYNIRLRKNNSLEHILQMYKEDGINTTRGCCSIWRPDLDACSAVQEDLDTKTSHAPNASFIWTFIRNNEFNLKLGMRSNDIFYGMINVFEFTALQEILYEYLKRDLYPYLKLGKFIHDPLVLFAQKKNSTDLWDISEWQENEELSKYSHDEDNFKIQIPAKMNLYEFTGQLYRLFESMVRLILDKGKTVNIEAVKEAFDVFFDRANCPSKFNSLYLYAVLPLAYLSFNRLKNSEDRDNFIDFIKKSGIILSIDIEKMLQVRYGLSM